MKLLTVLESKLRENPGFVADNGELKKWVIISQAQNYDEKLLAMLLEEESLKSTFFTGIAGALVFRHKQFIAFLEQKNYLNDSYTQYKNKIGLTIKGKFLRQRDEVELVWPYKDCILEGGQNREEQKREEIFFNETLARDEITQLLEPKVLTQVVRFTSEGEQKLEDFRRSGGRITDNLIIKGNNLLAMHSLKKEFAGRVKLIYIDPPYNTGNDGFKYNDSFNHSTWLTFVKNRLEIAKELLNVEGILFVHCDNNEQAYLKVIMDELFGREQYIDTITVVNNPRGRDYGGIANMHEFIHVYVKNQLNYKMYKVVDEDKEFPFRDETGPFETRELRNRNTAFNEQNRPNLYYPFYINPNNKTDNGFLEIALENKPGFLEVWPAKSGDVQTVWRWGKDKALENLNVNIVGKAMQEKGRFMIVEKYRDNARLARSVWWDKEVNSEKGTLHLKELFDDKVFNFPKPETLIARIIEIATREGDIVLDYHLGSGTTATTAHKMKRQYIGIEQMDYIRDIAVERLKKVIAGEQGGVSKSAGWKGGGDFVYFELKKYNEAFIERIRDASATPTLLRIWEDIKRHSFLDYNVDIRKQDENIAAFAELELKDQKRHLLEILDKNQLYVNLSSLEDADFACTEAEKQLSCRFYQLK